MEQIWRCAELQARGSGELLPTLSFQEVGLALLILAGGGGNNCVAPDHWEQLSK